MWVRVCVVCACVKIKINFENLGLRVGRGFNPSHLSNIYKHSNWDECCLSHWNFLHNYPAFKTEQNYKTVLKFLNTYNIMSIQRSFLLIYLMEQILFYKNTLIVVWWHPLVKKSTTLSSVLQIKSSKTRFGFGPSK